MFIKKNPNDFFNQLIAISHHRYRQLQNIFCRQEQVLSASIVHKRSQKTVAFFVNRIENSTGTNLGCHNIIERILHLSTMDFLCEKKMVNYFSKKNSKLIFLIFFRDVSSALKFKISFKNLVLSKQECAEFDLYIVFLISI